MSARAGKFQGTIREFTEDESEAGKSYYALSVEIPAIKETLEARFYFSSEKAIEWSKDRLGVLGVDCAKDPSPQLQELVGRAVGVRMSVEERSGTLWPKIARVWLAVEGGEDGGNPILQALGLEEGAADAAAADDGGFDESEHANVLDEIT